MNVVGRAPTSRRRLRVIVACAASLGGLCLAEVGLRILCPLTREVRSKEGRFLYVQTSRPYATEVGTTVWEVDFAERATREQIAAWDAGRPTTAGAPTPDADEFVRHPVRGWEVGSGVRGRGPVRDWRGRASLRIVAVGDSCTFGSEVKPHEAWCDVLERSLPGAQVLNCGVPGYGVDQVALKLDEYGTRLRPNVVLWGLINDDVLRAGRAWFPRSWLPKPQLQVHGDVWTVIPPRTRAQVFEEVSGWTSRVGLVARAGLDLVRYRPWVRECVVLTRDLVRICKARVESWGGRLIIVHMPTGGAIFQPNDEMGQELMGICRELGLEVVDVAAGLRAMGLTDAQLEAAWLRPGGCGHYSPQGNALIARVIQGHLTEPNGAGGR